MLKKITWKFAFQVRIVDIVIFILFPCALFLATISYVVLQMQQGRNILQLRWKIKLKLYLVKHANIKDHKCLISVTQQTDMLCYGIE